MLKKNRYSNIFPCMSMIQRFINISKNRGLIFDSDPHSRVKLRGLDDDYINASYLQVSLLDLNSV